MEVFSPCSRFLCLFVKLLPLLLRLVPVLVNKVVMKQSGKMERRSLSMVMPMVSSEATQKRTRGRHCFRRSLLSSRWHHPTPPFFLSTSVLGYQGIKVAWIDDQFDYARPSVLDPPPHHSSFISSSPLFIISTQLHLDLASWPLFPFLPFYSVYLFKSIHHSSSQNTLLYLYPLTLSLYFPLFPFPTSQMYPINHVSQPTTMTTSTSVFRISLIPIFQPLTILWRAITGLAMRVACCDW